MRIHLLRRNGAATILSYCLEICVLLSTGMVFAIWVAILIVSTIPFLLDTTNKGCTVSLNAAYGTLCAHVLEITIRPFFRLSV
jgi:hypothetical protein